MSGVKWVVEVDNKRECYRILTDVPVMEHDGIKEENGSLYNSSNTPASKQASAD